MTLLAKAWFSLLLLMLLGSCGPLVNVNKGGGGNPPAAPPAAPPANPIPDKPVKISFQEVSELLDTYCGACHANSPWLESESSLKRSSVKNRLANKTKPPGSADRKLPEEERALLLKYPF